jgi:purine-binding chemotaxis protein CheW
MTEESRAALSAERLRREFDEAFREVPRGEEEKRHSMLALSVAGEPYAVRLAEVAGLFTRRRIQGIPGPLPELLGLAGFRGEILPVYDLPRLLGYGPLQSAPGALLLTDTTPTVALAIEGIPEHFTASVTELVVDTTEGEAANVRAAVSYRGLMRPVLDVPSLVAAIRVRAERGTAHQGEHER